MAQSIERLKEVPDGLELILDEDEVKALAALLACVVYDPNSPVAVILEGVQQVLDAHGYEWNDADYRFTADPSTVKFPREGRAF